MNKTIGELATDGFSIKQSSIGGEVCTLITPNMIDVKWTHDNLIYRSSIWNSSGELVSAGFKKFFNYGENYQLVPDPTEEDLKNGSILAKIDGSCLIVSRYNGHLITRTRGTFDVESSMPNGSEIQILKTTYPKAFSNEFLDTHTLLFEWTTPSNVIVIRYGDTPDIKLIGAIRHCDYTLMPQCELDELAISIDVPRPKCYTFTSINNMIQTITSLTGEEGVVVYYGNDQIQKKLKTDEYLKLHRFKSNATWQNVLEMYLTMGFKTADEYREYLTKTFDYECFSMVEFYIGPIIGAHIKILSKIQEIKTFVTSLDKTSRKDCAVKILNVYDLQYKAIAFFFFFGGEVPSKIILDLMKTELHRQFGAQ